MKNKLNVMPSLLSADFSGINSQMKVLREIGITDIHYDVMDGHFVPNISFGPKILGEIQKSNPDFNYDVHLMITDPEKYIDTFIVAKADAVT